MYWKTLTLALLFAASTAVLAAEDLSLEPCLNGEVSSSGLFPTQEMEDQIHAYLEWQSDEPYYLFRMASESIDTPYEEN